MSTTGIDVSRHQGSIDWAKVKASGVQFAILRAGYGKVISQRDSMFEANYRGCKSNNIPVGAYWYSYAKSVDEAKQEAKIFLEVLSGKQFEFPVYFDIEEKSQLALGKDKCTAMAKAFVECLEEKGYFAGIYSSKSHLETYIDAGLRKEKAIWVAHYGVENTNYNGDFGMWQKSSNGNVTGISGNVDIDVCYLDYPAIIKKAGLNGFGTVQATAPVEPTKSIGTGTIVIDGKNYKVTLTEE